MQTELLYLAAVALLKRLISTPSISRQEDKTAGILEDFLQSYQVDVKRIANNVYAMNRAYSNDKPTILLNSHHDTVKPNKGYTLNPFEPIEKEGKLYGLGSNDAGGCLVSLIATFLYYYEEKNLPFNLVLAATAEEEISGTNGIELTLPFLGPVDCAIVGEPTLLQMAVAERGLMVLDAVAPGIAGHAARDEGENALYNALDDIQWIRNYPWQKTSPLLGDSRMTVTVMDTDNKQHNVVPSQCSFVIDVRLNELYNFEEVVDLLRNNLKSAVTPRSMRLRSTAIPLDHPLVMAGLDLGLGYYGSPTTSDKALMPFSSLKMGPGDSARSHTADEFIFLQEIKEGIDLYIALLEKVFKSQ